jgi:hypothetical protein
MAKRHVSVFFYGSFINLDVLKQAGLDPKGFRGARLHGWDIHIGPLATLTPTDNAVVYGIVVECTHEELDRLYAQDWVSTYLPEAVLVEVDGAFLPALTYVKWDYHPTPPEPDYVERIAVPGQAIGFPEWYIAHIRSFI